MTILSIIFGVLMIICGFSFMFTPLITFMDAGWFIVILVAVYGLIGLIKGISEKIYGVRFVFSVLSVIFGIAVIFFPRLMLLADGVLIYMVAVWFVMQGFVSVERDKTPRLRIMDFTAYFRYSRNPSRLLFLFPSRAGCGLDRIPHRLLFRGDRIYNAVLFIGEKINRLSRKNI